MDYLSGFLPDPAVLERFDFLRAMVLTILSVKLAGHLSRKLGQPSVFGKLLAGVVLGPAVLGWLAPTPMLKELSEVGVVLLMFLAGLETDLDEFRRAGLRASAVAVAGVLMPFAGGWALGRAWGYETATAVFIGALFVATSVSISVQTLRELGKLQTREGVTILAAAVLDDVLGLIVLSMVLGLEGGTGTAGSASVLGSVGLVLVKIILFFATGALVGWKVVPALLRWFRGFQVGMPLTAASVAVALAFAYGAELFGLAGIVGAYLVGLILSTTELRRYLFHEVEIVTFSFFTSFFFVGVGLAAQFNAVDASLAILAAALIVMAVMTKLLGCGIGAVLTGFRWRSAAVIGSGMVARGEVGLIVAGIGLERGLIDGRLFTAAIMVVLATTILTPPLLRLTLKGERLKTPPTRAQKG